MKFPPKYKLFRWMITGLMLQSIGFSAPIWVGSRPLEAANELQTSSSLRLLPFFDDNNNPVKVSFPSNKRMDITPAPPVLSEFDQAVLRICGPMGTYVQPANFKNLLRSYPEVLDHIQESVGGQLRPGRDSAEEFLADLTDIWFERKGFEHIFCGEIDGPRKIGGLHFVGRYWQLQKEGLGGRMPNNEEHEEVVSNVIYTLGVMIRDGDRMVSDDLKGYSYVTDAQEMLTEVTQVFKAQGTAKGACLHSVMDEDSGKSFQAVFVKERHAIITFYPDATPRGKSCLK